MNNIIIKEGLFVSISWAGSGHVWDIILMAEVVVYLHREICVPSISKWDVFGQEIRTENP